MAGVKSFSIPKSYLNCSRLRQLCIMLAILAEIRVTRPLVPMKLAHDSSSYRSLILSLMTLVFKKFECQNGTKVSNCLKVGSGLGNRRGILCLELSACCSCSMKVMTKRITLRSNGTKIRWLLTSSLSNASPSWSSLLLLYGLPLAFKNYSATSWMISSCETR